MEDESDREHHDSVAPKRAASRGPKAKANAGSAAGGRKMKNPDGSQCRRRNVERYNQKTYGQVAVTRLQN